MPETIISVRHQQFEFRTEYFRFTARLESILDRIDHNYISGALGNRQSFDAYLQQLQADTGLILFTIEDHGAILDLYGKPTNLKQYVIGNPLIAVQMTLHDVRAALYAPLRIIVYESRGHLTVVEYDLPSTLFGQFGDPAVAAVGLGLDTKLYNLLKRCEQ